MMNVKTVLSTQLTVDNYPIWKAQILTLFSANGFESYLDGSIIEPPPQILSSDGASKINPLHQTWKLIDQNLASALYATISPSLLPYVLNLPSYHAIWTTIQRRFQSTNPSKQLQLKSELLHLQKGDKTMVQYLSDIKQLVDAITAAGSTVDSADIILYTLKGLPQAYNGFKTAVRSQIQPIGLDDFYSLLCTEELNMQSDAVSDLPSPIQADPTLALQAVRGRPHGRGRFSYNSNRGGRSSSPNIRGGRHPHSTVQCQICNRVGHSAFQCWYRTDLSYQPVQQAYMATDVPTSDD
ncbi:Retrovirus-related Pol polyprotein from transposon TNT 1-94 [Dendrobium catenatum]|uniref:Retrovirus-related Pol polyprotein from transposon TNT 1-94 n=1 Tax=Dendrobium catenatum TaxID=906689 RepID=A0A2I0VKS5_9ASPA|nr:Retrovirus-related Pol polyprotein from transposon TNT 1-94 [Dendrobium catenatum]